jgi:hypothetical protein
MSIKSIIFFFIITTIVLSEEQNNDSKQEFFSIIGDPWSRFLGDVKYQSDTGMCWAFSVVSYIETMYNILTRNKYRLSAQQIGDNIQKYFHEDDECFRNRPNFNGYSHKCALRYVEEQGIMTEYDYPFTNGGEKNKYNSSYTTPIGIKNIRQICTNGTKMEKLGCLVLNLQNGPILAAIHGVADFIQDSYIDKGVTHAVLLIDIVISNEKLYIKYQNSWSTLWGDRGFGYIRIDNTASLLKMLNDILNKTVEMNDLCDINCNETCNKTCNIAYDEMCFDECYETSNETYNEECHIEYVEKLNKSCFEQCNGNCLVECSEKVKDEMNQYTDKLEIELIMNNLRFLNYLFVADVYHKFNT